MDEKKKQMLERDAKIRQLQTEIDQLMIRLKGHSEDNEGKVNRLEKQVKELTDERDRMKVQLDAIKKEMELKVHEAKAQLIDQLTEKDKIIASMQQQMNEAKNNHASEKERLSQQIQAEK